MPWRKVRCSSLGIRYVHLGEWGTNDVGSPYNVRVLSMRWLLRLLVVCFVVPAGYVAFTMVRAAVASELSAIDLFFGVSTLAAFVIGIWIVLDLSATVEDF